MCIPRLLFDIGKYEGRAAVILCSCANCYIFLDLKIKMLLRLKKQSELYHNFSLLVARCRAGVSPCATERSPPKIQDRLRRNNKPFKDPTMRGRAGAGLKIVHWFRVRFRVRFCARKAGEWSTPRAFGAGRTRLRRVAWLSAPVLTRLHARWRPAS